MRRRLVSFCPCLGLSLILTPSALVLGGCSEVQTVSGNGGHVTIVPADSMVDTDAAENPVIVEAQAEVIISELEELKIVTSQAKAFIARTLSDPSFEVQVKAIPVMQAAIKVEPSYKGSVRAMLEQQIAVALPEDRAFWQEEAKILLGQPIRPNERQARP